LLSLWKSCFPLSEGAGRRQAREMRRMRIIRLDLWGGKAAFGRGRLDFEIQCSASIRWSARQCVLQEADGIGRVLRETPRSHRTPRDPLPPPDRRSMESRKPDNQIPCALVSLVQLLTPSACSAQQLNRKIVPRRSAPQSSPARSPRDRFSANGLGARCRAFDHAGEAGCREASCAR
jgi:hypothetical protein